MTTIPASVVLRAAVDLIAAQRQRLHRRVHNNPRESTATKTEGRKQEIARLERMERELQALSVKDGCRADVAGLLLAWAAGHVAVIAELEEIEPRIAEVASGDVVAACRILLGGHNRE